MGLKTRIVNDHHFVDLGAYIIGRGWGSMVPAGLNGGADPVINCLTNTIMPFGTFLVEPAAGHYSAGQTVDLDLLRYKPEARAYQSNIDYTRGDGILPSIITLSRYLNGMPTHGAVPSKEKEVSHPSIRGSVELRRDPSEWRLLSGTTTKEKVVSGFGYIEGNGFDSYQGNICHSVNHSPNPTGGWTYYGHNSLYSSTHPRRLTTSTVEQMLNGTYAGIGQVDYSAANLGYRQRITALNWVVDKTKAVLDYNFESQTYGSGPWHFGLAKYRGRFTIELLKLRVPSTWPSPSGGAVLLRDAFTFNERWERWLESVTYPLALQKWWGSAGVPGYYMNVNSGGARFTECVVLSDPVPCRGVAIDPDPIPRILRKLNPWNNFAGEVAKRMGDIRLSSYQSTYDAYELLNEGIEQNLIEQLAGLGSIAEYLPRLTDALAIMRKLYRKDLPGTVRGVIDLATEMRLRYAFQYAPDLDFVVSTLPRIAKVATTLLQDQKKIVEGRGKFEWEFPANEFYRPTSRLVTRTKIVGLRDNNSVVSKILGLDRLGILPTPSRAWDLIPLSFVADWFVNIGDRLRDIEGSALLLLTPPSYLVHSFTVSTDLSDEELSDAGLMPYGTGDPVEWRYYVREVSTLLPSLRQGRYDFRLPAKPPSWQTAGSLAWQITT